MVEAALTFLENTRQADGQSQYAGIFDDIEHHYRHRLAVLDDSLSPGDGYNQEHYRRHLDLSRDIVQLERRTAVNLRNEGRISDELLRKLERELDLEDERLRAKSA